MRHIQAAQDYVAMGSTRGENSGEKRAQEEGPKGVT